MGRKLGIPLVATNDCHYVNRTDAVAHDVLMAIQTGKSLKDEKRLKHQVDSYYLKSPSEMDAHFKDVEEAIANTEAIAAKCNVKLKLDQTFLPTYKVPEGEVYVAVESPRGELGCYIVSDGSSKPMRMHVRAPSFVNLQTLPHMMRDSFLADTVAIISSVDPIMGEVDR
jgi:DNA polymerase III alpha subunit